MSFLWLWRFANIADNIYLIYIYIYIYVCVCVCVCVYVRVCFDDFCCKYLNPIFSCFDDLGHPLTLHQSRRIGWNSTSHYFVTSNYVTLRTTTSSRILFFFFPHIFLYSTLLYSTLLYSTLLYSTLLYSTLLYSTLLYSTLLTSSHLSSPI